MSWQVLEGNALDVLKTLPTESVHCIVTSPPYWGLRKYEGVKPSIWGGKPGCRHKWASEKVVREYRRGAGTVGLVATRLGRSFIGIEASPVYAAMASKRITNDRPLFNQPAEVEAPPARQEALFGG